MSSTTRTPVATIANLGAMALLVGVGVVGFGPLFGGTGYLVAGFGGLVLGLALAWSGARFRLGILTIAAATIATYLLFGAALALPSTAIARILPSLASLHGLLTGVVQVWKQVLTVAAPVGAIPGALILPFFTSLLGSVIAGSLALRLRHPGWALLPATTVLVVAIVFGTGQAAFPLVQGLVFALVAVSWFAWRVAQARDANVGSTADTDAQVHGRVRTRRLLGATAVAVTALVAAVLLQPVVAPANARQILRTSVVPPINLQNYPSPLQSYRKYVKAGVNPKNVLFTVQGLQKGTRIRLATLDSYDGTVYSVAADGGSGAGSFSAVTGGTVAAADPYLTGTSHGMSETITVTTKSLDGVWLPDIGYPTAITFARGQTQQLSAGLDYNPTTGVAITTAGLAPGDTYTVQSIVARATSATASASLANVTLPQPQEVPDAVSTFAAKATSSAQTPLARLIALSTALSTKGFFSHGLSGDFASLPGHGAQRLSNFLGAPQIVGDDEQYAVAMSLMANQLGIPARVVMGFYPKTYSPRQAIPITGADLHAWVEVDFNGVGWIAFDPTPDANKKPNQQLLKTQLDPKAQVLQPPPAPPVAVAAPNDPGAKGGKSTKLTNTGFDTLLALLPVGGEGLGVLLILFGPLLIIGFLKARRRRRRAAAARVADRLSGGWDEIVDTAYDLGTPLAVGGTRKEGALMLAETYPAVGILEVATAVDTGVFGPVDPSDSDTEAFWLQVDQLIKELHGSAGRWRRLRARMSIATFLARRKEAAAMTPTESFRSSRRRAR